MPEQRIDEYWLGSQIEGVWGAHGAHAEIYREVLRRARGQAVGQTAEDHAQLADLLCRVDSLTSLVAQRHRNFVPDDVVDDLKAISLKARHRYENMRAPMIGRTL